MKNRLGLIFVVCAAILLFGAFITYGMRSWGTVPFTGSAGGFGTVTANGVTVDDWTTHHTETLALEDFSTLHLNVGSADVKIAEGTAFQLEYHYYGEVYVLTYRQDNGALTVQDDFAPKFQKKSSGRFYQGESGVVYRNWVGGGTPDNSVILTVPTGTELAVLDGKISVGDCEISGIRIKKMTLEDSYGDFILRGDKDYTAGGLEITLSSGDAQFSDLRAQTISVEDSYGDVSLNSVHADTLKLEMSSGDLTMRDVSGMLDLEDSYGEVEGKEMNTTGFSLEASSGDVSLEGAFTGKTDINASYGEVSVETSLKREDYALDLHTSCDAIRLDGKRLRDEDGEDEKRLRENEDAPHRLSVDCSSGGIEIRFAS